jgi:tRNA-dihydrouridine synthase
MLDETGCDGVLVAKGSFGNPTIFRETEEYLRTGVWKPSIDLREKISILKKHLQLVREFEGDRINWRVGELGKVCLWYLKGFAEASRMRARIFASKSDQELISLIDSIPESRPAA